MHKIYAQRFLTIINEHTVYLNVACMTGALWAKRGERDISRGARHEREARDEGISFPRLALRAPREISRSPCLAHKAPVMQANLNENYQYTARF